MLEITEIPNSAPPNARITCYTAASVLGRSLGCLAMKFSERKNSQFFLTLRNFLFEIRLHTHFAYFGAFSCETDPYRPQLRWRYASSSLFQSATGRYFPATTASPPLASARRYTHLKSGHSEGGNTPLLGRSTSLTIWEPFKRPQALSVDCVGTSQQRSIHPARLRPVTRPFGSYSSDFSCKDHVLAVF